MSAFTVLGPTGYSRVRLFLWKALCTNESNRREFGRHVVAGRCCYCGRSARTDQGPRYAAQWRVVWPNEGDL